MSRPCVQDFRAVPLNYQPHAAQRSLHRKRGARFLAACCGRRGGKTRGGAAEFADRMLDDLEAKLAGTGRWTGQGPAPAWDPGPGKDPDPFLRYAVVAPTYALLDEPRIKLQQALGMAEAGGLIVHQAGNVWWLIGGIRIDLLSGDRPERLVSHGYDGVWLDEAARLKPAVWRDNLRPTLSDTGGWCIMTTTPLGRNWFWRDVWAKSDPVAAADLAEELEQRLEDVLDPSFAGVGWTTADNTAIPHLAQEMEDARRQMPEALWRRNYLASFDAFEGQLFDLVQADHLRDGSVVFSPHALARKAAGLDLGWTHKTSLSLVGMTGDGRWHELATHAASQVLPNSDLVCARRVHGDRTVWTTIVYAAMRQAFGPNGWRSVPIHLPADRPDVVRLFRDCGFYVQPAFQSHEAAVTWAQIAFHNRQLTIGSRGLWRCLTGLHYPEQGRSSSKLWVNEADDEWDGLRYALSDPIQHGELVAVPKLKQWLAR
jgi:hypothetical protein